MKLFPVAKHAIVLTYWEKKNVLVLASDQETFEIGGWRQRICKTFEITRTICSNSERSEQFLVTECFFNFLEQLELKLEPRWSI